jgi:hypothetical protein
MKLWIAYFLVKIGGFIGVDSKTGWRIFVAGCERADVVLTMNNVPYKFQRGRLIESCK